MNRRNLLGKVAVVIGVSGCISPQNSDTNQNDSNLDNSSDTYSYDFQTEELSDRESVDLDKPARITQVPSEDSIEIEGAIEYGSPNCRDLAVTDIKYKDRHLSVVVSSVDDTTTKMTCDGAAAAKQYTLVFTFEQSLPKSVEAVEVNFKNENIKTTSEI